MITKNFMVFKIILSLFSLNIVNVNVCCMAESEWRMLRTVGMEPAKEGPLYVYKLANDVNTH